MRRVLLIAVALGAASPAVAYVRSGFRWSNPPRWQVNTASSVELGRDDTLAELNASYATWSAPACSGFSSQYTGETNAVWRVGDGVNTHYWIYDRAQRPRELGGQQTIAVTLSVFQGGQAVDGDILYNGIDHRFTTNPVRGDQVDAQSISTHEIGHQLGLNHSPIQSATMYAAYLGGTGSRTLDRDDIEGVCALYPSGAAPECRDDGGCPDGERCFGGQCVAGDPGGNGDVGDPCGPNGECANGNFCVQTPQGDTICTRECQGQCPAAWDCTPVSLNGGQASLCLPGEGDGPGAGEYGDPCEGGPDCVSGFCVSNGSDAFCSQLCEDASGCPGGDECAGLQGGGGACVPGQAPPPPRDASVEPPPPDVDAAVERPALDARAAPSLDGSSPVPAPADAAVPSTADGAPLIFRRVGGVATSTCGAVPGGPRAPWVLLLLAAPVFLGDRRRRSGRR